MSSDRIHQKGRGSFRSTDGWWARGYLPHFDEAGVFQFVTIRLADSLPRSVSETLLKQRAKRQGHFDNKSEQQKERYNRLEKLLDAGYGACWLKREEVALIVVESLKFLVGQGHRVIRWVIMPNHLHLLIELLPGSRLSAVIRSLKGYTGKAINAALGRRGPLWYPEFFDRYIRDEEHYNSVISYIDNNPVRAGLVQKHSEWRFSSAGWPEALATKRP